MEINYYINIFNILSSSSCISSTSKSPAAKSNVAKNKNKGETQSKSKGGFKDPRIIMVTII